MLNVPTVNNIFKLVSEDGQNICDAFKRNKHKIVL